MDLSINNNVASYATTDKTTANAKTSDLEATKKDTAAENPGAVYEKSKKVNKDSANQIYNKDAVIAKLKADQQSRIDSMQNLVEKLLGKQKDLFDITNSTNLAETFRAAAEVADPETIEQAKEDISEDGYWGVEQTSDRLVSMAIALSGGDTKMADTMMDAIQEGYDKATKAWGEELPEICAKTVEAAKQKLTDWKNGVTTAQDYSKYLTVE